MLALEVSWSFRRIGFSGSLLTQLFVYSPSSLVLFHLLQLITSDILDSYALIDQYGTICDNFFPCKDSFWPMVMVANCQTTIYRRIE